MICGHRVFIWRYFLGQNERISAEMCEVSSGMMQSVAELFPSEIWQEILRHCTRLTILDMRLVARRFSSVVTPELLAAAQLTNVYSLLDTHDQIYGGLALTDVTIDNLIGLSVTAKDMCRIHYETEPNPRDPDNRAYAVHVGMTTPEKLKRLVRSIQCDGQELFAYMYAKASDGGEEIVAMVKRSKYIGVAWGGYIRTDLDGDRSCRMLVTDVTREMISTFIAKYGGAMSL